MILCTCANVNELSDCDAWQMISVVRKIKKETSTLLEMNTMENIDRPTSPSPRSQAQGPSVPQTNEPIVVLRQEMTALADAVRCGKGIATSTNYAACPLQKRDTTKKTVAEMTPPEWQAWDVYTHGRYPLPNIE